MYCVPAQAALKQFIPRYIDYSCVVGASSFFKEKKITSSSRGGQKKSDLAAQEDIGLSGFGYIYSPLFISMQTSASFGFEQRKITSDTGSFSGKGDANQFKQVFKILPAHPYNLELWGQREQPLTLGDGKVVVYNYGARAIYLRRPWSFNLTYIKDETSRTASPSENDTLTFRANYFDDLHDISSAFAYAHTEFSTTNSIGERDLYDFIFDKAFNFWRFNTRYSYDGQTQDNKFESTFGSTTSEQQAWNNRVSIDLPLDFKASLTTDIKKNNRLKKKYNPEENETDIRASYTNSERYSLNLHHQLYKSLSSTFLFSHHSNESPGGESNQDSFSLNSSYRKEIPWGFVLCSLYGGIYNLNNKGAPQTLFENHSISNTPTGTNPSYTFIINSQNIEQSSITVRILDRDNNNNPILLSADNYTITSIPGGFIQVAIDFTDPLPTELVNQTNPWEYYVYQVDYTFIPADYILRSTSWGSSFELPLFDTLVTPFYSYAELKQKEIEGDFSGSAVHSKSHAVGLKFQYLPFSGGLTRSWSKSKTHSTNSLSATASFNKKMTSFSTGSVILSYINSTIEEVELSGQTTDTDETFYTAQALLQIMHPVHHLIGSFSANYSFFTRDTITENRSYSITSGLDWRVGQLDFDLSATYTNSENIFGNETTEQQYTIISCKLKRKLF